MPAYLVFHDSFNPTFLDLPINAIVVHGRKAGGVHDDAHFSLYFSTNNKSLSVNPVVGSHPEDPLAITLTLRTCQYRFSKQAGVYLGAKDVEVNMSPGRTIGAALRLVLEKRRDAYRNESETGSGCRHWCRTVLGDLEAAGWIREGRGGKALNEVVQLAKEYGLNVPTDPEPRGGFL